MTDLSTLSDRDLARTLYEAERTQNTEGLLLAENEVAARLELDPDETEQGFTPAANDAIDAYMHEHYPEAVLARPVAELPNERQVEYVVWRAVLLMPKYGGVAELALHQALLLCGVTLADTERGEAAALVGELAQRYGRTTPSLDMAVFNGVLAGDHPSTVASALGVDLLDVADVLARYMRASMEKVGG